MGFVYALNGLRHVVSERNMRFHILAAILVVMFAILFDINRVEWLWCVCSIAAVMAMETINTAVERLSDVVSPEKDERIKIVKDLSAAAVLITAIGAAVVGGIVFVPYLLDLFQKV